MSLPDAVDLNSEADAISRLNEFVTEFGAELVHNCCFQNITVVRLDGSRVELSIPQAADCATLVARTRDAIKSAEPKTDKFTYDMLDRQANYGRLKRMGFSPLSKNFVQDLVAYSCDAGLKITVYAQA